MVKCPICQGKTLQYDNISNNTTVVFCFSFEENEKEIVNKSCGWKLKIQNSILYLSKP